MHNHIQPKIEEPLKGAVPKVMNVALIELVEMTATLNVVVSINSTTVMQTYWTASFIDSPALSEIHRANQKLCIYNCLIRFTISIAPNAQSYPLFPALDPARSIACSIFSVVITPNITGTPFFMLA